MTYTARGWKRTVCSPAFRRFFARIPAKAGTTNIGQSFPARYISNVLRTTPASKMDRMRTSFGVRLYGQAQPRRQVDATGKSESKSIA